MRLFKTFLYSLIFTNFLYSSCIPPDGKVWRFATEETQSFPCTYYLSVPNDSTSCYSSYYQINTITTSTCTDEYELSYTRSLVNYQSYSTCPVGYIPNNDLICVPESSDADGYGIPDKCDEDFPDYDNLDCDDDGDPNGTDPDIDGDKIPNLYDDDNEYPAFPEGSPTCNELQDISEAQCNYSHKFDCVNGPPAYVTKDLCLVPKSPCMEALDALKLSCDLNFNEVSGVCYDDGLNFTYYTLDCSPKPSPPPDCDRSWNEVLNTTTNECECASGYVENAYGDCWKSNIDENSTQEEIDDDEEAQDLNNDEKKKEIKEEEQKQNDINSSIASNTLDNTRNDTLTGIRRDLNTSNKLLSLINDKLSDNNETVEVDDSLAQNYDDIDDLFSTILDSVSNIQASYSAMFDNINNGFNINVSSGSNAVFSTYALGTTISVDFCEFLPALAPVFYYIFYLSLLILSIKIFYYGFKVG